MRTLYRLLSLVVGCAILASPTFADSPQKRELVLQAPPATSVDSVAVSPDGSLVATGAGEGGVRLYDARTGALLRTIGAAGDRGVSFSPDGKTLSAAGFHMDKLVGIFDVQTGERVRTLAGLTEWEAYAAAVSPDGKLLASTGTDKQILVWELSTGKLLHQIKDQIFPISALAFSPDSATLASGGGDKLVRLWDSASGKLRLSLAGHGGWICSLAFSPDGKSIASGACDWGFHRGHDWLGAGGNDREKCEWKLWDVASGKLLRSVDERGRMLSLAFAPGGKSLACSVGKDLRLYDLTTENAGRVVTSHDATITSIAFTPDAAAVVTGSHDQTVKRTSLATGKTEWRLPGYFEQVNSVALSPDAALLVTGSGDHRFARGKLQVNARNIGPGAVRLWDAKTGRMLRRFGDAADQIMAVAVSSDGRRVAGGGGSADGKGVVRVWDAATGKQLCVQDDHAAEVLAVAFAPDGASFAAAAADGLVKICDSQTGSVVRTLTDHAGGATSIAFTQDGKTLIVGQAHGGARLWDAQTGKLRETCQTAGPKGQSLTIDRLINSIGLSASGETLATCASSVNNEFVEPVRLWNVRTGALVRDFAAENIHGRPMALSPDGSILATGGKAVQLWDVRTGKKLRQLLGHLKRTQSITFSADGRLLIAGGSYGTTNAWEVATGRHLVTLFAFSDPRKSASAGDWLAYHPEGFYDCSPGGERYVAWRVGDEFQTADSLEKQLHRPERIEAALGLRHHEE
jgi:WD40 repeat protein